ncbi:MAG: hypothetical protein R2718_04240 [Solirubrobacterales bacterium]
MNISIPGVGHELAVAVRRVDALRHSMPVHERPDMNDRAWLRLESELDRACASGRKGDALASIYRWEQRATAILNRK